MTSLIERLSQGEHPVSLIRYKDVGDVNQAIERGFVLVKFTGTEGGTEIGISLNKSARSTATTGGKLGFSGSLTLDYQPVTCTVSIDPETLQGHGSLQPVGAA